MLLFSIDKILSICRLFYETKHFIRLEETEYNNNNNNNNNNNKRQLITPRILETL